LPASDENIPPEAVASSGKAKEGGVKVKGLADLWYDFWGMEPKEEKISPEKMKNVNWDEAKEEKEKVNVWEKMLSGPKKEASEEGEQ
jgi:hypothetical protein